MSNKKDGADKSHQIRIKEVFIISKRKRYIKGKVYIMNDHSLVKNSKSSRRVVAMNNDKNEMAVRRILSLYDKNGNLRKNLIPIEKYPDIRELSGVEVKTFRKTLRGKPIKEECLKKTKTRLNKWDMKKISTSKRPRK